MTDGGSSDELTTTHTAVAEASDEPPERREAASTLGRFTILQVVGAGGMGQVYAAYDPQLDRRVALKVLHASNDEVARQRLVREAQALARLSHPNVVAVHEVGEHAGRVFVAMEFVEGETLKEWAQSNPIGGADRLQRALEHLIHAGRGLAAAHDAGLVHRDVKPGNILVGRDGRVRVADFGLARAEQGVGAAALERSLSSSQTESVLASGAITRTGMIAGTPAYMAPEQLAAQPIGPATDQFGFCVTAWELLFGRRPFPLKAIGALLQAIKDGRFDRPEDSDVPAEIEAALRQGLAYRPKRRHASMQALLEVFEGALRRSPAPNLRRRRWTAAAMIGGLASAAAAYASRDDRPACADDVSAFDGIWDDARRGEIEKAVLDTNAGFAEATWNRLAPALDAWRDEWIAAHVDACEATHVRGEQSAELLDLRMACLHDRRRRFAAFLEVLAEGDVEALSHADDAFAELPTIQRCADARYVRANVAEAMCMRISGDIENAEARARLAVDIAETTFGAEHIALTYPLDTLAGVLTEHGERRTAVELLERAMALHVPHPQKPIPVARLLSRQGSIFLDDQRVERAVEVYRRAFDLNRAALGEHHPATARARIDLGAALGHLGQDDEAIAWIQAGLAVDEAVLGSEHPDVALVHDVLASEMERRGDMEAALEHARRAFDIFSNAYGPDAHALIKPHGNLCNILASLGRPAEAVPHCERALELANAARGHDEAVIASLHNSLGTAQFAAGRLDDALRNYERALELWRVSAGEGDFRIALVLANIAEVELASGDYQTARDLYTRSTAMREALVGRDHPALVVPLTGAASAELGVGERESALALARRAQAICAGPAVVSPLTCARAGEVLAKVLWSTRGGRKEATELAAATLHEFEAAGAAGSADLIRIRRWLETVNFTPVESTAPR